MSRNDQSLAGEGSVRTGSPVRTNSNGEEISPKSRLLAALLCWFFGALGIHRFYLGRHGSAVLQILLGWLTLFIWNFVDFILIVCGSFRDSNGYLVKDWSVND